MANWYGTTRTNYFKVNDEERYQALFNRLTGEEPVEDFTKESDGETWHAFGSYSDIMFTKEQKDKCEDEDLEDFDVLLKEISKLLTPDSVFVITCVGNEKLRYLTGICNVVFPDGKIIHEDLAAFAYRTVKDYFGQDYVLYLDY